MKKIPTLLVRDPHDRAYVTDEVTEGCAWVLAGEGVATRKYDGTCMRCDDAGGWWARREVKEGQPYPESFVPVEHDETTGKTFGWVAVDLSPFFKFWREAWLTLRDEVPGTYELVGPKINGNPEKLTWHRLLSHDGAQLVLGPCSTVDEAKALVRSVAALGGEGVVWHHPDGRMVKLKARDLR
jgi:hypothetical protein